MAGLKEIRTRIASVTTTRQVTNAMKMVSAARLKKAQDAIFQIVPYARKLQTILSSLSLAPEGTPDSPYTEQRDPEKILIVLVSSNRGLCGAFNTNSVKKAVELINTKYSTQVAMGNVRFLTIGRQGEKQVRAHNYCISESNHEILDRVTLKKTDEIAQALMDSFVDGSYDRIELVYNHFKNAVVQDQSAEQFLPVEEGYEDEKSVRLVNYIYEPSKTDIIRELIPKSLKIQFYRVILDSCVAEHGARMTAMHQATDNASDLLDELRLHYNKARQSAITTEILEITSGAEALKK